MKRYELPFGKGVQTVNLPEDHILYDLHGSRASVENDLVGATKIALRQPIDSKPLQELIHKGETVAIVVSDITRPVHTAEFLPVIMDELNEIGIADEDMVIVIATGAHRGHSPAENSMVCGEAIVRRIAIHQHDSKNKAELVRLGVTSFGTAVDIDAYVAEADNVIITGAVSVHPMAGFGGGRKAIVPGVAGYDTIMQNHALALASGVGDGCNPACNSGLLTGNPFHEDMMEATELLKPTFLVNMVFTPDGDLHEVVAGHWRTAWEKGCQDLIQIAGVPIAEQADVVIASAGGFPKDLNLYQATKAHMNAIFAVKPGGIIIFTLDCPDIREPAIFTDWLAKDNLLQFEKDVRADFSMAAFVAFKTRCIIESVTIYLVTRPDNFSFVRQTGQIPATSLEEAWGLAQKELINRHNVNYTVTIMSHGSATLPILQ